MRVKVGRLVDVDKDVNLADLTPLDRIISSAVNAYRNTSLYRRRYAETEEKKEEQKRKVRQALTDSLLAVISLELGNNHTLRNTKDTCIGMLVKVPARFKTFIREVIETHEFDAYSIIVIPPSPMLSKFSDPPYLLYIENRGGV